MSVHYLVDFENVHEAGLDGMQFLTAEDCVYIFHTSANDRISLSCLDDVQAWVKVILVPPGWQSLDMHLGTFLGYLIGKEDNPETQYAIISHDTGYRRIAEFWNRSYQMNRKVVCLNELQFSSGVFDGIRSPMAEDGNTAERIAIRDFIINDFAKHGTIGTNGFPCMLVSELCTRLNGLPEYSSARQKLGKRPLQYLRDECQDILWINRQWQQDWVYLIAGRKEKRPDNSVRKNPEEPVQEDAGEGFPEMDDLSIGDESYLDCESKEEPITTTEANLPEAEKDNQPELLAAAMEYIRNTTDTERNERGHIRASVLRDELMKLPAFRTALKESGQKPIQFIRQLFIRDIWIYQEKEIYWAGPGSKPENTSSAAEEKPGSNKNPVIAERKNKFYEEVFSNIRKQLTDAGMENSVADEIADICMHSNTASEPRKAIQELLCKRFGTKIGAQYYRKTVKYMVM